MFSGVICNHNYVIKSFMCVIIIIIAPVYDKTGFMEFLFYFILFL